MPIIVGDSCHREGLTESGGTTLYFLSTSVFFSSFLSTFVLWGGTDSSTLQARRQIKVAGGEVFVEYGINVSQDLIDAVIIGIAGRHGGIPRLVFVEGTNAFSASTVLFSHGVIDL
jgi:hypothetical protein